MTKIAMLSLGLVTTAVGQAAEPPQPSIVDSVVNCRSVQEAEKRLACYDAATARLSQATADKSVVVVTREDARKTRRSLFGFNVPKLPLFSNDESADDTTDEIETVLKSARSDGYGKFTLIMEDGAVWRTTEAVRRMPKAGARIRIRRAALGSYMINIDGATAVRALRVG